MKISFLIPTCNRLDNLKRQIIFLSALPEIDLFSYEIVVGDNSDNTETEEYIKTESNTSIVYFKNHINIGYGRNVLKCYSLATGDYIWLLGDKNYFDKNFFYELYDMLKLEPNALVIVEGEIKSNKYIDENILLSDLGYKFANLNRTIIRKDCLTTLERCNSYSDFNFSHIPVLFEYLASLNTKTVFVINKSIFKRWNTRPPYWQKNVFKVFARDWFYTIMMLPNTITIDTKLKCLKGPDNRNHIFSPSYILRQRLFHSSSYSFSDYRENRKFIDFTSHTNHHKVLVSLMIPLFGIPQIVRLIKTVKQWH